HQRMHLAWRIARNPGRIEAVEGFAEALALAQYGDPGETGLKAIEDELLVERPVVIFRHAPFLVMVAHIERVKLRPRAAVKSVGVQKRDAHGRAAGSPGNAKCAQCGLNARSATPPAASCSPAASASLTRSRRSMASPRPCAVEPSVPTDFWPALTGVPGSGAKSSKRTATTRVRAVPRCSMRDTTSWPTKQPLAKSTPPSWSMSVSCGNASP